MFSLKIWWHYLYKVHCTIYMLHKSLRYLMDHPNLNMRQRRWLDMVKDYEFEILYHPGKANVVDDALNRQIDSSVIGGLCMRISIDFPFLDLIREAQAKGVKNEY